MSQGPLASQAMADEDPQVLLRVGYHKSATTWLQRVYFPARPGVRMPFERVELSRTFAQPHPFTFDPDAAAAAAGRKNVNLSDRSIRIIRWLNGLIGHPGAHHHLRPMVRLPRRGVLHAMLRVMERVFGKGRRTFKPKVERILGDEFVASNRALGAHLDKDLARWGYVAGDT